MERLVDIDESALEAAQRRLGTSTVMDTVNAALKLAASHGQEPSDVSAALDTLATFDFADRSQAWR